MSNITLALKSIETEFVVTQNLNLAFKTPELNVDVPSGELNRDTSNPPFFIVGLSRSGSTLLSRMLDSHPAVAVFPETWCFVVLDRLGCLRNFDDPWQYTLFLNQVWDYLRLCNDPAARVVAHQAMKRPSYVGPSAPILDSLGRAYAEARGARMWGEKTPGHVLWLPQIHHSFPNARIIVTVRDPRDVLVSYDDRWGLGRRDTAFLMRTAALVRYYLRRFLDDPAFPSDQIFLVKYEELTSRPAPLLTELCQFLNIEFEPSMVEFYVRSANWVENTAKKHHALLSQPTSSERVGRYRSALTSDQINAIDEFLSVEMQSLGYARDPETAPHSQPTKNARAAIRAQARYEQMQAGAYRRKLRRRGRLVLRCYKHLGSALALFPTRRMASDSEAWRVRADSTTRLEYERPLLSIGPTPDEQLLGLTATELTNNWNFVGSSQDAASGETESAKFRQRIGQISKHSAMFFAGTMFTGLAGYLFKVYLARMLGAEALGIYALGMTIVAFLGVFNGLGLTQAAIRFVPLYLATGKSNQLRGFLLRGVTLVLLANVGLAALVVLVGPWLARNFYHTMKLQGYLPLFALIMLLGALTQYGGQILQGYKDVSRRTIITNFIGTPLVMVLTIGFLLLGWGLWGYIFAQVVSALLVVALLFMAVWKLTPREVFRQTGPLPPLGSQVASFGVAALGITLLEFLLAQTDKILIGYYLNPTQVGVYALAMAIIIFVPIGLQSVNQIFSPTIADLHSRGEHQLLERLFQTLTKWILAFTLPLAIAIIAFAEPLMRVFGKDFASGWLVLVIGTVGQVANCGTGSVGYLLMMSGHQNRLVKVQASMAVTMVLLCVLLIPRWGILGAIVAASITNIATNVWNLAEVRSSLGYFPYNRSYLYLLPATVTTAVAEFALRTLENSSQPNLFTILGNVAVGFMVFGLTIALTSGLDADDRLVAGTVLDRFRGSAQRAKVNS